MSTTIRQRQSIHPSAQLHSNVNIGKNVEIGAFTIIGPGVWIGDNCKIGNHVVIENNTIIGNNNHIYHGAIIGQTPQDLKFKGSDSRLIIGNDNIIREYVTVSGGTEAGETRIGDYNMIMSYTHIGHDSRIHNHTIISNSVQIAGHVEIENHVVIGGLTGVHQFCKIGRLTMIGGMSGVNQDIAPFLLVNENPLKVRGLNTIGLKRNGVSSKDQLLLKRAFKLVYRSKLNTTQALKTIQETLEEHPLISEFIHFIENSTRGIHKR